MSYIIPDPGHYSTASEFRRGAPAVGVDLRVRPLYIKKAARASWATQNCRLNRLRDYPTTRLPDE